MSNKCFDQLSQGQMLLFVLQDQIGENDIMFTRSQNQFLVYFLALISNVVCLINLEAHDYFILTIVKMLQLDSCCASLHWFLTMLEEFF